jgi:hypothetical protein
VREALQQKYSRTEMLILLSLLLYRGGTEFLTSTKKVKKHVLQVPSLISDSDSSTVAPGEDNNTVVAPVDVGGPDASGNVTKSHAATMKDLVHIVLRDLITERHSMLVEPDGSM